MDDEPKMPDVDDADWARRVAAIEKEFRQAERRRRVSRKAPRASLRPRRFTAAHLWIGIAVAIIAYAIIATVTSSGRVPVDDFPQPVDVQTVGGLTTPASAGAMTVVPSG